MPNSDYLAIKGCNIAFPGIKLVQMSAAHERKESEKHQQNLERQKNDEIQKQQGQMNVSDFLYLLPITLFQRCISRYLDGGNFEDSVLCLKNAEYFVE